MLAYLLSQYLVVLSDSSFVEDPLICFLCYRRNPQYLPQSFHHKGVKTYFFILPKCPAFTTVGLRRVSDSLSAAGVAGDVVIVRIHNVSPSDRNTHSWCFCPYDAFYRTQ